MKKISSKIFIVTICCSCLAILILGNISIINSSRMLKNTSQEMLTWMVRYYASKFSSEFIQIEDKVSEMEVYFRDTIDVDALKTDPNYLPNYEEQLAKYIGNFAEKNTDGVAAWCYFNPELSETPHDVYFVDEDGDGIPERQNYIPFSYYDNTPTPTDDKQWWYGPIESKGGFWTNPYEWRVKSGEVIKVVSYAVPIYIDDELIAVIGTYYHFERMLNQILDIKVFENGYAALFNEKLDIVVHPTYFAGTRLTSDNLTTVDNGIYSDISQQILDSESGHSTYVRADGAKNMLAYSKLSNGWTLAINPPIDEIFADLSNLIVKLIVAVVSCMAISIIAAWYMGKYITKPLLKVVEGANEIGAGNLSVEIPISTNDEIKIVAKSINEMVKNIDRLQQELAHLAYYDDLTDGNNLNKFKLMAKEKLANNDGKAYYLSRVDIDGFKIINDMFGFDDGDIVLKNMHKALSEVLSESEFFARISNDDFIVFLERENDGEVINIGNIFKAKFEEIHRDCDKTYNVTFSFGIYKIHPPETDITTIIDRCTMVHKTAKQHSFGKNYAFYSEQMRDTALKVKSIEDTMHKSLKMGEFVVYLQPKFDLKTKKIKGAEALIRWIKPQDNRVIPPIEFIPVFEKNGFVANIDLFVLEEVCKLQRGWLDEGLSPVPISINQSKVLIFTTDYIERVTQIVDKYNIPHNIIELEILETLIHYDIDTLKETVFRLKELGFLVSIDDFGSGYSSLNMLKDINADVLKIDREFLNKSEDNERGEIVLSNIIRLAGDLNMSVVTEGVETEKQAEMLRNLNCDTAQGYLFAKPMPIDDYNKIIH